MSTEASNAAIRATRDWQALDARHYLHPFTDFKALAGEGSRIIPRAEGVYLYDSDGRQSLAGTSRLWCEHGYAAMNLPGGGASDARAAVPRFFKSTNP